MSINSSNKFDSGTALKWKTTHKDAAGGPSEIFIVQKRVSTNAVHVEHVAGPHQGESETLFANPEAFTVTDHHQRPDDDFESFYDEYI